MTGWTEDRNEQLKALWIEGCSAAQCARAIGGVSRNGVIGKVHRLGLELRGRQHGQQDTVRKSRAKAPPKIAELPPIPVNEPGAIMLPDGSFFSTRTIWAGLCHFPKGDPKEPGFHYCAHRTADGATYCGYHHAKAYVPAPQPRQRRAP